MDAIRRYVITLTAAAMLCALVKAITAGAEGTGEDPESGLRHFPAGHGPGASGSAPASGPF